MKSLKTNSRKLMISGPNGGICVFAFSPHARQMTDTKKPVDPEVLTGCFDVAIWWVVWDSNLRPIG